MEGFGLLVGHLLGDYILQNDWQAQNKTNPLAEEFVCECGSKDGLEAHLKCEEKHWDAILAEWRGHLACTVHCLLYTLGVWACSFWWMPWWGLVACFLAHWPVDRFRLAGRWMRNVSGQKAFATGPLSPWSIIVVDNVFHLLTLFVIGLAAWGIP